MKPRTILTMLALGAVVTAGATACATDDRPTAVATCEPEQQEDCELIPAADEDDDATDPCTVEEQHERDDDCGYYDNGGAWLLYPWVISGRHSTPPPGWKRPAGLRKSPPLVTAPSPAAGARTPSPARSETQRTPSRQTTGKSTRTGSGTTTRRGGR
ncbi:hypothetical protein ACIBTV_26745 [Micromonospora sp. NPDC049366]|uniref:hypothetical protein n=1 Tax=Micromonospora sp. NPDC049366 TaxID=3364271 RepID=UPI0037BCC20B